jgi:hypothetical protein
LTDSLIVTADPEVCRSCGHHLHDEETATAKVTAAKVVGGAWVASGKIELKTYCPNCGMTLAAVERAIPIQCEGLRCPDCHSDEHLTCEVTKVDNDALEFSAIIGCKNCNKKRRFTKWLTKILSVLSIKIGPVGISTKKETNEDE